MKSNNSIRYLFTSLVVVLFVGADLQAKSLSYYRDKAKSGASSAYETTKKGAESAWEKTKSTVESGYEKLRYSTKQMQAKASGTWNSIDPETKNKIKKALIGAGAAIGTAVVVGGVSYGVSQSDLFSTSDSISSNPTQDKATFDQLISFLSTDSNYKGDQWKQLGFLDRFDGLNYDEKMNILDIVGYEEAL